MMLYWLLKAIILKRQYSDDAPSHR